MAQAPIVFISSTSEDLKDHRQQAAKAARALGFHPLMMEDFPANGRAPTLDECLREVEKADLLIAVVAHRYGWVPNDAGQPDAKSITWLECEHAWNSDKEVLAFLVDPNSDWPPTQYENYRLVTERKKPGILQEVERNESNLTKFKNKLSERFRKEFTDPLTLRALVAESLAEWLKRHPQISTPPAPGDPETYLQAFFEDTRQIRIRKLKSRRAEPYVFDIEEIYIPLTTLAAPNEKERFAEPHQRRTVLEHAIRQRKVVIIGNPGSGKTTFLNRIAFELCRNLLSTRPKDSTPFLPAEDRRFPIRIRTADLTQLLAAENKSPKPPDAADWLPYFLGKQNEAYNWGVDEAFFQNKLKQGGCLVMVDGLDEAPNRHLRERVSRIFEKATMAYAKCDFLVTTRPQSYERDAVLSGFTQLRIGDLELPEIKTFFHHFARALALPDPEAKAFQEILESALAARPEIREMARNPVMLTALAVLQHNSQKLPEYRVELYESILLWLAAARDAAEGRPTAEKCLELLRKLALYMQDAPSGRIVVITKRAAAELAAAQSGGTIEQNEELLERETQDSGIISSIGSDLKFWHLSFQEYLAAREVASLSDEQQVARVVKSPNLFHPEWREMLRLLGGILKQQGVQKVEGLVHAILDTLGDHPTLEKQTRCAALLSAMMRDLKPMGYKPSTEKYEKTVKAVMRIFEPGESEQIDIKTRIEAANLLGQVGDPRLDDDNWVVIPAGTFKMGAKDAESREAPIHEVTLKPLRIGRFPVTVHEYQKFIKQGGYAARKYWSAEGFEKFTEPDDWEDQKRHPNRPVVGVSWYEAAACCAWAGGRLLTEAEWERAARGPQSAQHPWGNQPPLDHSRANYDGVAGGTTPVGLYPAGNSVEGICDLLGNVYEWCSDWYGPYSPGGQDNPAGPPTGEFRAARGGCWYNDSRYVRVSNRFRSGPADRHSDIGFRCARDA